MLTCFPDPYPDEIFYSICARYSERMRYPSIEAVKRDLFSVSHAVVTIAMPYRLASFVSNLPRNYDYSVDRFINEHTLFPLFRPFLFEDQLLRMREDMRAGKGSHAHTRSGVTNYDIPFPKVEHLRFCSVCINEDRKRWGECYWHRIHQAPGVHICPTHKALLRTIDSDILRTTRLTDFLAAEKITDPSEPTIVDTSDFCQSTLLDISLNVAWILRQHNLYCNPEFFGQRYHVLLAERGLAAHQTPRRFNISALLQEFKAHYPVQLLQILSCELSDHVMNNWLRRLLYNKNLPMYPLYHLLLIHFLGHTIETFVRLPKPHGPFGDGPWPCLNPVSEHYQQRVIRNYSVSPSQSIGKRPKGIFSCECGFVYSRLGPDSCADDSFKLGKVLVVGPVWEEALRKLWADPSVNLRAITRRLGLNRPALLCHAARLGLLFPRPGGKLVQPTRKLQIHLNGSPIVAEKQEYYRKLWLKAIEENPGTGSKALQKKHPKVYDWLNTHDRSWQKEHMPQQTPRKSIRGPLIDWKERDKQTADKAAAIALQIRSLEGQPEQVTRAAILRRMERGESLKRYLIEGKLPITKQALDNNVESTEEFVIRRIYWMKEVYLQAKRALPKRWQFVNQTGARGYQSSVKVKQALDAALQTLEVFNSF